MTIYDYGINWDNPLHFNRGQAYLHYFLTGEKNYQKLPKYPSLKGESDYRDIRGNDSILFTNAKHSLIEASESGYKKSYYQSDVFNFEYFEASDSGHPPLNGILAATTNNFFFQKLGILDDVTAHQIVIIISSFVLVLAASFFVFLNFGFVASLVATISLSFYPLFFAESHFNIKDPMEASFFGLTIISFYFGIIRKKFGLILISAMVCGLALGTKFNALFIPFVLVPWFGFYLYQHKKFAYFLKPKNKEMDFKIITSLLFFPLISLSILLVTWPYLWSNLVENLLNVLVYYKEIGIGVSDSLKPYLFYNWNTYPSLWLMYTTPIPILFLSLAGFAVSIKKVIQKEDKYFLILLWFLVPLLRVSIPGSNIYGGVRQIMEIVPAIAIFSGIGAASLIKFVKPANLVTKLLLIIVIFFSMALVVYENLLIHPNQNVYFNQIAGGLPGAKRVNIPSWGNSFGNAYMQGVHWINNNAEFNAKLGLPIGNMVNIPRTRLRRDIHFSNDHFSAFGKEGEYEIELAYDYPPKEWFSYQYLDKFLLPVYEVKVQGVPILKVWKNDLAHTKAGYDKESYLKMSNYFFEGSKLLVELEKPVSITRLYINHLETECNPKINGSIYLSIDGKNFQQEPETLAYPQMSPGKLGVDPNKTFFFLFPGKKAKFIRIDGLDKNSCLIKNPAVTIYYLNNFGNITVNS